MASPQEERLGIRLEWERGLRLGAGRLEARMGAMPRGWAGGWWASPWDGTSQDRAGVGASFKGDMPRGRAEGTCLEVGCLVAWAGGKGLPHRQNTSRLGKKWGASPRGSMPRGRERGGEGDLPRGRTPLGRARIG